MGEGTAGDRDDAGSEIVVCDSSPLISFERIGRLDLLRDLFGTVLVPPAVVAEIGPSLAARHWIVPRELLNPPDPVAVPESLGPGEREAIALALELRPDRIVLDDLPARLAAEAVDAPVVGAVGVVLLAKQEGFLPEARPVIDALIENGFRLSTEVYRSVLASVGEEP